MRGGARGRLLSQELLRQAIKVSGKFIAGCRNSICAVITV